MDKGVIMQDLLDIQNELQEVVALISFLGTVTAENLITNDSILGYQLCTNFTKEKLNQVIISLDNDLKS